LGKSNPSQVILTCPDWETRATNGPGTECGTLKNPRQCRQEDRRDLEAPEIPRRKDEHPGFAGSQRRNLQRTVSQPLILGENDPTTLALRGTPKNGQ
jgi:hypothetical protein